MSKKYLLPRPSGSPVVVDVSQAGRVIEGPGGEEIQVPTYRELVRLEPYVDPDAEKQSDWNPRTGIAGLGGLILAAGVAFALLAWFSKPQPPNFRPMPPNITPADTLDLWQAIKDAGLQDDDLVTITYRYQTMHYESKLIIATSLVVVGAVVIAFAYLLFPNRNRPRPGPKSSSNRPTASAT